MERTATNSLIGCIFNSEQITKQQSHIDRLYVSLKDMVEHRKTKLEQQYWLYQLNKEVEELEKWITEREAVASSTELGQDLEHVTVSPSHGLSKTTGDVTFSNIKRHSNIKSDFSILSFTPGLERRPSSAELFCTVEKQHLV